MESNYLEFIQKFLGKSPVMIPEQTGIEPSFRTDRDIRIVVFDIYGTIMISASGDIEESEISVRNLERSLKEAGIKIKAKGSHRLEMLSKMLQSFRNEIARVHNRERSLERPYPEVDILSIWENILNKERNLENLEIPDSLCFRCFTFVFETLSNSIYPMPGMKEVINNISLKGFPLGIISNAQFYTPVILNYFLNGRISEEEVVIPFDPEITVYSFKHKRAKPDSFLFEIVTRRCREKYHVAPEQILFVGNDMFRDVYPAHNAGYKTVLFAGDNRSLRLREEQPELSHITPDHIITDLSQLLKIIT
jgi:putative hydrolase of the HAD superfamily